MPAVRVTSTPEELSAEPKPEGGARPRRGRRALRPLSLTGPAVKALGVRARFLTGGRIAGGGLNTMVYRADNLRHRVGDSEANKLMVWDELGYTGYIDLVEENAI